jgi:hypothetical protein
LVRAEDLLFYLGQLNARLQADACNGRVDRLTARKVEVAVVNRVVYAGGIEYSFTRNAETALRAAFDLQGVLPHQPQAPVVPSLPADDGRLTPVGMTPPPNATDATLASGQRLAGLMQAATGETGQTGARAGIATSFGIGTFGSLALKQDFNRPIAVGMGARIRYPFYHVLAGNMGPEAPRNGRLAEFRFGYAQEFCQRHFPDGFDASRLRAVMGLPLQVALDPRT